MKFVRKRLTYANVMSTLAVFLVVAGGSALAAGTLGKNTVGSNQLKKNAVTTAKVKNNAITGGKIANGAVTGSKLGGGAVGASNLAANSVGASAIADNAVGGSKIANGAVTEGKLGPGSVTESKLGNDAVTGAKVKDGSLTGSDIQQASLTQVKAANVYGVTFAETGAGSPKILNASDPGIKSGGCFLVCSVEFPRNVSECSYTASSTFTAGGSGEPAMAETFPGGTSDTVLVVMWNDEGNLTAHDFAMTVVCPTTS
ncbi:MAG TPA: hypothetical protein VN522_02260 [Solirubrobacterales bacterium]|nr:hypothetical protein [Solirubrobacterales bacterium]